MIKYISMYILSKLFDKTLHMFKASYNKNILSSFQNLKCYLKIHFPYLLVYHNVLPMYAYCATPLSSELSQLVHVVLLYYLKQNELKEV